MTRTHMTYDELFDLPPISEDVVDMLRKARIRAQKAGDVVCEVRHFGVTEWELALLCAVRHHARRLLAWDLTGGRSDPLLRSEVAAYLGEAIRQSDEATP